MKLAIISHTPHYIKDNKIVGWGPTVREINYLTKIFEEIFHIAPLHKVSAPDSSLSYDDKINFIPLKNSGGETLREKLTIISTAPNTLSKIKSILKKVDWVQFRAPTAMGIYVLPYLSMRSKPRRWVKYAGNWNMKNAPLSYRFQKWWLENNFQKSKVTINGHYENQSEHVLDFQNPCLDNNELKKAREIAYRKNFDGKLTLSFVGSLTQNKGVDLIFDSLLKIKKPEEIEEIILSGDGKERKNYEEKAAKINLKISFTGFLERSKLNVVYEKSHLIILPSESEGFPKVIAEGAAYGCVPIVSDVSSIGQYFNSTNGFLLKDITANEIAEKVDDAGNDRKKLKEMSINCLKVAELFTFENYNKNLLEKILLSN